MMYCFKKSIVEVFLLVIVLGCWINVDTCEAFGTFGFDIHHRYSDRVKDFLDVDGLPDQGSLDYFAAMVHRDQLFKARRLTTTNSTAHLTFIGSNQTVRIASLGFLHYAVVNVGTPPLEFLVALDTGSDLFWIPCDCTNCVRRLNMSREAINLNIYSPDTSSSSKPLPCNSTMCGRTRRCSLARNACAYQEVYLSSNTSTTGILVNDVLHLGTYASPQNMVEVPITLGCGINQTGDFLDGAAVNGLFGLGMDNVSVPSILASSRLTANSFSMCFGPDGNGRINFGDKGSSAQRVTPFNLEQQHPSYNITVTQISLEDNVTEIEFSAIFDSGTSFTYLNDPAYSVIGEGFNSRVTEPRYQPSTDIIFDYCYELSATQEGYNIPSLSLNLTMRGGSQFYVYAPTVVIPREVWNQQGGFAYCLALVRSHDINIIGQNFMTGYRIVFDREEMTLGWQESNCYDSISSNTLSVPNTTNPAPQPSAFEPEATPANRTQSPIPSIPSERLPPPTSLSAGGAGRLNHTLNGFVTIILSICFYPFIIRLH